MRQQLRDTPGDRAPASVSRRSPDSRSSISRWPSKAERDLRAAKELQHRDFVAVLGTRGGVRGGWRLPRRRSRRSPRTRPRRRSSCAARAMTRGASNVPAGSRRARRASSARRCAPSAAGREVRERCRRPTSSARPCHPARRRGSASAAASRSRRSGTSTRRRPETPSTRWCRATIIAARLVVSWNWRV